MATQKEKINAWKAEQQKRAKQFKDIVTIGTTSTSWGKLEIPIPDFSPLERIAKIIDELRKVLQAVVNLLNAIAKLLVGLADAAAALIKQIIDQIREFIEGLLTDAGLYTIFIPNGKRFNTTFAGLGDITPPMSTLFAPAPTDPQMSDSQRDFLVNANRYSGGNPGFYRQVAASLNDRGDRNRPQFMNETDWVGGLVLMLGTNIDPFGFLDDLWKLKGTFGSLFKSTNETKVPKPQNLQAYPLVKPGHRDKKLSVLLKWDTLDVPIWTLPDLGNIVLIPKRRAIFAIRNNILASTANNVLELVGTRDITESTTSGDDIFVVSEREIIPGENSYVVRDLPIEDGDVYHFALAWQLRVYGADDDWTTDPGQLLPYWDLSNMPQVYPFPTLPDSTPPDWSRTSSVADIMPPVAYFIRVVAGYLEMLANRLMAPSEIVRDYIEFLRKEMLRYEQIVESILLQIRSLTELLMLPKKLGGVYIRSFEGEGGNQFFLSDLAKSLTSDFPNAPPFHRGDEYVMGIILMAGGPQLKVKASTDLLKTIFVSGNRDIISLTDTLGEAISGLEEAAFEENFNEKEDDTIPTFNEALQPTLKLCHPPMLSIKTFGDNLQPEES